MRLPDWSESNARWDTWRAFHISNGPITRFDTGEVVTTSWYLRDRYHLKYIRNLFGLDIIASTDFGCRFNSVKLSTPDGDEVLRSWIPTGKCFLYDRDTKALVRMGFMGSDDPRLPLRFRNKVSTYIAGPGSMPIGGELSFTKPRKRTKEEQEKLDDIRALAKAWLALDDEAKQYPKHRYHGSRAINVGNVLNPHFNFEQVHPRLKQEIATCGFHGPFETIKVSHLKMEVTD